MPNISEGRDRVAISRIVERIALVPGVRVLHVDSGISTNRTVITFVGEPESCLMAGVALFAAVTEHIDMRHHVGAHPRLGAVDVFPFVPLRGATMDDCVGLAHELGQLVWQQHKIPVYFYECAAMRKERQSLVAVRRGEYEGLPAKLEDPAWQPDVGEARRNERSGAAIIGARKLLVAYNIGLATEDVAVAKLIAGKIRESGTTETDADGTRRRVPGRFSYCRAIGWRVPELGGAQVSVNFTDYTQTGLLPVFEACVQEARALGTSVRGSELIGLVPQQALLDVVAAKAGEESEEPRLQLASAASRLKLDAIRPFSIDQRVLELRLESASLSDLSLGELLTKLGAPTPAPAGGSAAAIAVSVAAALLRMATEISERKASDDSLKRKLILFRDRLDKASLQAQFYADEDARTFADLLQVRREARLAPAVVQDVLASAGAAARRIPQEVANLATELLALAADHVTSLDRVVHPDARIGEELLRAAIASTRQLA